MAKVSFWDKQQCIQPTFSTQMCNRSQYNMCASANFQQPFSWLLSLWLSKVFFETTSLTHYKEGFLLICIFWYFASDPSSGTIFRHALHVWSLLPECSLSCLFRLAFWENVFGQQLHMYSLSPECTLSCVTRLRLSLKPFWQMLHM